MRKKLTTDKAVRKSSGDVHLPAPADLARLRIAMSKRVDTSDIADVSKRPRLRRDATGKIPPRRSIIREAVAREMKKQRLTVYRLWQLARRTYPPLSQSAVHEFLKGQRQLELPSIEALLVAIDLRIESAPKTNRLSGRRIRTQQIEKMV